MRYEFQKNLLQVGVYLLIFALVLGVALSRPYVSIAADQSVATEQELRDAVANASDGDTITLTADIELDDGTPLTIIGKDITLAGNYKISQMVDDQETIHIRSYGNNDDEGPPSKASNVTLNGPIITHGEDLIGHGIYVIHSSLTIESGEITGNSAALNGVGDDGGGIYVYGTDVFPSSLTISGGKIHGNTGSWGGGIAMRADWVSDPAKAVINITGGEIYDNIGRSGGGIFNNYGTTNVSGGKIYNNTARRDINPGGLQSANGGGINGMLVNISGGEIYGNTAEYGGAVFARSGTGDIDVSGGKIYDNLARETILNGDDSGGLGGGLYCSGTISISGDTAVINSNEAEYYGGGIFNGSGPLTINGGSVFENTAEYGGGGIYDGSGALTMSGGNIYENSTANYGGGIFHNDGTAKISGGKIYDNDAGEIGGGILHNGGTMSIADAIISGNKAPYAGGIYNEAGATLNVLSGTTISGNIASAPYNGTDSTGGGIYTQDYAELTVADGAMFSGNIAMFGYEQRNTADDAVYADNILSDAWTAPFTQGYNNFDINYLGEGEKVYTVTFYKNDGTDEIVKTVLVPDGGTVGDAMPADPAYDGHSFDDWDTKADHTGEEFSASTVVNGNMDVYAQWEAIPAETYTVTHLPGTRGTFTAQTTPNLSLGAATPDAPTTTGEAGWIFDGWSPTRSATVTGNAIYTAQWRQETTSPTVTLAVSKSLTDESGDIVGTGKKFAIRLYDEDMNLVGRYILSANEDSFEITGLASGAIYYLQEEESAGFTIVGFEVVGVGEVPNSAVGLRIPTYKDNLKIEVIVKNRAEDLTEISDEDPPLGPYEPPVNPPTVEIPEETKNPGKAETPGKTKTPETTESPKKEVSSGDSPGTGDNADLTLWGIVLIASGTVLAALAMIKRRKRVR